MKHTLMATILLAAVLSAACSKQESAGLVEKVGDNSIAPSPPKVLLTYDLPKELSGLGFEVGGKCAVDTVNTMTSGQTSVISKAGGMAVDGWAFNDKETNVPAILALQLANPSGQFIYAKLSRHAGREDLAKAFGNAEFATAGYSASIDIATLPVGSYDMLVIQKTENINLVCPTYRKLVVKD